MKVKLHNFLYLLLGLLGFKSTPAVAAEVAYLCNPDGVLRGEVTAKGYEECIDVLAWSWGGSQADLGGAGPGGSGTVDLQDVAISKYIDKSTAELMSLLSNGTHLETLKLFVIEQCLECPEPFNRYRLEMSDVLISSVSLSFAKNSQTTEHVTLNFSKIQWCSTDSTGKSEVCDGYVPPAL